MNFVRMKTGLFEYSNETPGIRIFKMAAKMAESRASGVWDHVSTPKDGLVVCNYCKHKMKFSGPTTNIRQHLTAHHRRGCERDLLAATVTSSTSTQPSLHDMLSQRKPYARTSREYTLRVEQLVLFLVDNKLAPFAMEQESTKCFLNTLDPRFSIPCHQTITSSLIPAAVARLKWDVIEHLRSAHAVSLTLDMWTEKRKPYLVVNAHCVTKEHAMDTFCLTFELMPESHTAANLRTRVLAAVEAMIPHHHKIVALTTDTTSNVKKLGADLPYLWIPCTDHVINLTVHDAIDKPAFAPLIEHARALATSFRNTQKLSMGLETRQRVLKQPIKPLVLDVATRWNSLYLMLHRLVEQKSNVQVVLVETNLTQKDLSHSEWALMAELLAFLEPFYVATVALSAERHVSMSFVAPLIHSIWKRLQPAVDSFAPMSHTASALTHELKVAMSRRLADSHLDPQSIFRQACALDPRFKSHPLHESIDRTCHHDVWHFIELGASNYRAEALAAATEPHPDPHPGSGSGGGAAEAGRPDADALPPGPAEPDASAGVSAVESVKKRARAVADFMIFSDSHCPETSGTIPIATQLLAYRAQAAPPRDTDPLLWWKERARDLPALHAYAMRVLCIQPTEVAAERAFSWAGMFFDDSRASMRPQTLSDYMFIYSNHPLLKRKHSDEPGQHEEDDGDDAS